MSNPIGTVIVCSFVSLLMACGGAGSAGAGGSGGGGYAGSGRSATGGAGGAASCATIAPGATGDIRWDRRVYVPKMPDSACLNSSCPAGGNCALGIAVAAKIDQTGTLTICTDPNGVGRVLRELANRELHDRYDVPARDDRNELTSSSPELSP